MSSDCVCPHDNCFISSLRGLRNGVYYGAKVRFVHSLVMTFLFKNDTFINKLKTIISLTYEHSRNLGLYVFIYKSVCCLLRKLFNKNYSFIPFVAGVIGSFFMWSTKTSVNQQIMLYLLSRNVLAISDMLSKYTSKVFPGDSGFAATSILCWGLVMFLFEGYSSSLQPSLHSSMDFIYNSSNVTVSWKDFVPFYIP